MDALFQDLRSAVRALRKTPGVTVVAVITLTLGIGANTAIFSVVDAAILHPLPYPDPDRVVMLSQQSLTRIASSAVSAPNFLDWQAEARSFEAMGARGFRAYTLTGVQVPEQIDVGLAAPALFDVIGIARGELVEEMSDGVLVADMRNRPTDLHE